MLVFFLLLYITLMFPLYAKNATITHCADYYVNFFCIICASEKKTKCYIFENAGNKL